MGKIEHLTVEADGAGGGHRQPLGTKKAAAAIRPVLGYETPLRFQKSLARVGHNSSKPYRFRAGRKNTKRVNALMGTKDDRPAGKSGLRGITGGILAALALGAILCAAPVMAQTAPPVQDAAPAAKPAAPVEPTMEEPKSPPRITDALLPSALPRDLSPWGMFLSAVPIVKIVMVGLAFASLVTWTIWLAKTIELWYARRVARRGLEVLASAKSLRAAEKELAHMRSPWRFVAAAADKPIARTSRQKRQGPRGNLAFRISEKQRPGDRRIGVLTTIGATAPHLACLGPSGGSWIVLLGYRKPIRPIAVGAGHHALPATAWDCSRPFQRS